MDRSDQLHCARRLLAHIENHTTDMALTAHRHDVSDYTSSEQLAAEKLKIFRRYPIFVGFSSDLGSPGDYLTETFVGVPVLIVRATNGTLKAFLNMCSHRAAPVASGCGKGQRRFICPYHGWAYNTEGQFLKMSMESGFAGLEKSELNLRSLPVAEKYGLVWVGLSPDVVIDVEALLDGLAPDFAAYGLDKYHHYKTMVVHKNLNWKLVIDTFLENYHLTVLHGKTIGGAIYSHLQLVDAFGYCERLIQARRTFAGLKELPESEWDVIKHTAIAYVIFPNTLFIMQSDHVEIWRSFPDTENPNSSKVYFEFYIPQPATSDKARNYWYKNIDYGVSIVLGEDFPLGEKNQLNFQSGLRQSIIFGSNEPGLINYHKAINRALSEGSARPVNNTRPVPAKPVINHAVNAIEMVGDSVSQNEQNALQE